MKKLWILLLVPFLMGAAPIKTYDFSQQTTIRADEMNTNLDDLYGYLQKGVDVFDDVSSILCLDINTTQCGSMSLGDFYFLKFGGTPNWVVFADGTKDLLNFYTTADEAADIDYGLYTFSADINNSGMTPNQEIFEVGKNAFNDSLSNFTELFSIDEDGDVSFTGTLIGSGTGSLGWSVQTGVNTACTTTCTSPAVFGVDSGGGGLIVGPADATAEECLCAGAS